MVQIKGHEINMFVKDSSLRRAQQFKSNIIASLKKIGLTQDDADIPIETFVIKRVQASCSWYFDGHHLYISYNGGKFIENLYAISKVIEIEVNALLNEEKTKEEFVAVFAEEKDIVKQRKEARELLGVKEDCKDLKEINSKYKELAKLHHPDTDSGDTETFKKINKAHKLLKRELE